MDSPVIISDNSVSSTGSAHADIDKLLSDVKEIKDQFDNHLFSIIKLRSRCDKLTTKLRERQEKNLKVDDDIRRQLSVVCNIAHDSCVGDQFDTLLKLLAKIVSDVPTVFP